MKASNVIVAAFFCGLVYFPSKCQAKKDYYKQLGLEKGATSKEIKKAFRQLALKYHPDLNPEKDTSKRFIEITEAYEIHRDEDKRRQYDQNGHKAWGDVGNFNIDDFFVTP